MGPSDHLRVTSLNPDTVVLFVENADVGEVILLHGEDGLKICSQFATATPQCEWECAYDEAAGIVQMRTQALSADFALFCY